MLCSVNLTQCSSCDRSFAGPISQSIGALVKTVPEALAPCGQHVHAHRGKF